MAARKMAKTEQTNTENVDVSTVETNTTVNVDADALIKSILNNVNQNNSNDNRSKRYVLCRSVTNGGLNINCRSGNVYEFKDYGLDCEIEYDDLVTLVRKHSDHIFLPRFVIEDDDFLKEFEQVAKCYEKLYTLSDLNKILTLPPVQMTEQIKAMPKNVFDNLRSLVASKIADGSIDSVKRIRALSEIYDSDFNLLSELFSR